MISLRSPDFLKGLIEELCKLPHETEWVEFKVNNTEPQVIGEYLSALANSAALVGKAFAYLLWGVEDSTHRIVGTSFVPASAKVGNEPLENWLLRALSPKINFRFSSASIEGKTVVLLEIERAFRHPVQFQGNEFIRVGSHRQRLKNHPEKERALWRAFDRIPFEDRAAAERVSDGEVLTLLDYPSYFDLIGKPLPENRAGILKALEDEGLIHVSEAGGWNVSNLGAILFAKRLDDFHGLRRKAVTVIHYQGNDRIETVKERVGTKGYASGFKGLVEYINGSLPSSEVVRKALRKTVPVYPELAVRELVANALIHQDFFVTGAGPLVEIFNDRMEVTNPGLPLVDPERFLDTPPRSRNEALASLLRRIGICEERGSGIDKVVYEMELFQLPAPLFEARGESTRAVLLSPRPLIRMEKPDRVRACYLHACLKYVSHDFMTNSSLRQRFGIEPRNSATASRLIKEAVEAGVIRPYDEAAARKLMKYLPGWA